MLYQLSYWGMGFNGTCIGAHIENWTRDLSLTKGVLYPWAIWANQCMERVAGIEPAPSAWKAEVLPLNHTRKCLADKYKWWWEKDSNLRSFRGRFTVCWVWPLPNPTDNMPNNNITTPHYESHEWHDVMLAIFNRWCRLPESNWRPTDYKSVALPTELSRRVC